MSTVGRIRSDLVQAGLREYGMEGEIPLGRGDHLVWILFRWNAERALMESVADVASEIIMADSTTVLTEEDLIICISGVFPADGVSLSVRQVVHDLYVRMEWADSEWGSNGGLGPFIGGFFVCPAQQIDHLNSVISYYMKGIS